jgi:hypothetical protein
MGKREDLAKLIHALEAEGIDLGSYQVVDEGVIFPKLEPAKKFSNRYKKALVRIDGPVSRWLAKDQD